ncbi:MAG TPA: hypothetical protein VN970_09605, partial [Thermoanaerobaculia bacterium]|nr:hypothetical protein [Thermoanaerobaculia bacterium]
LEEVLAAPGVKVVEWAERLPMPPLAGTAMLALRLRRLPDGEDEQREIVEIAPEELTRPAAAAAEPAKRGNPSQRRRTS